MKIKHFFGNLLVLLCLLFINSNGFAQSYHNEWIDYNKTYYKFKVGAFGYDIVGAPIKKGMVRIPQSVLADAGLGLVASSQFQLWRNGKQVPIYVSQSTGSPTTGYYLEFWGEIADAELDKELYKDPEFQLSDNWSIVTDTASYFLTVNPSGNNLRLVNTANNAAQSSIAAEKNFLYTTGRYYRNGIFNGYGVTEEGFSLYLSSYERGEGWSSRPVRPNNCDCGQIQLPQYFAQLYADAGGAPVTININMMGNALNTRQVKVFLNGDSVNNINMGYYSALKSVTAGIPANKLSGDTAFIIIQDNADPSDEMRVMQTELTYSRKFNFGNASSFEFSVAASNSGRYLKITNFDDGSSVPVLYDLTNGKRYLANTSVQDTLRFLLQPSTQTYNLVLVRSDGSTAKTIDALKAKDFINYSKNINQGNYLIISNKLIYGEGAENYVEQYRAYRNSAQGGLYKAKVIDIEELEDQFALGTKMHPLAVKNFLRYARNNFNTSPAYAFIIGKGVTYPDYSAFSSSPLVDQFNLVPTYGFPGSDNLLSAEGFSDFPVTPIGRLSAVTPKEVGDYLTKIKEYESAQQNDVDSIENKSWAKKVLQLTGANDAALGIQLDTFMNDYTKIISDTLFGANTITFSKTANPSAYPQVLADFTNQYNAGCGILQYFGHSSSSSIDFSLNDPNNYTNSGRYPFFIVNGCLAGNIFDFDANRKSILATLSEKFVLAPQKGSIAYLSTTSFGIVNYLDIFTTQFYNSASKTQYGKGFGDITREALTNGLQLTGITDYYGRMHAAQYNLHGDPAARLNTYSLPDYAIQNNFMEVSPGFISAADDSIRIKLIVYNLGKAISSPIQLSLFKKFSNGDSVLAFSKLLPYIKAIDSININLALIPNRDTGVIVFSAVIDNNNQIAELNETNNRASFTVAISGTDFRPIYPFNYAIVTKPDIIFSASTANPLGQSTQYVLELDTTALFNSSLKVRMFQTSSGGAVSFPKNTLISSNRVYFWRVSKNENNPHWNTFSFSYKNPGNHGAEQAHFYQHTQSNFQKLSLDSATRNFRFGKTNTNVFVKQSIYPTSGLEDGDFSVAVNGSLVSVSACVGSSIIFHVFDSVTFRPYINTTNPYGAASPCSDLREINFEFSTQSPQSRKNAMDFLDNYVPEGAYVVIRKIYDLGDADWAPTVWASDTALYGSNNSLYHRLKDQGLSIDSFVFPRTFICIYRKNFGNSYTPISVFSKGLYDNIFASSNISTTDTTGFVTSPVFGPAKKWSKALWSGINITEGNNASLSIIGSDNKGKDSIFFTIDKTQSQQDISSINAAQFPYIKLKMKTGDSLSAIPFQLSSWTVEFSGIPEGAIAPNLGISIPDQLEFDHAENIKYDTLTGYVTFKNVSRAAFGKIKCALTLYDSDYVGYKFTIPKTRKLPAGDTVQIRFLIDVKKLPEGRYNLFLEVNPDNDQPEQYHFNNSLYKYINISRTLPKPAVISYSRLKEVNDAIEITAYPNPFKDILKINVKGKLAAGSSIRVFNSSGQMVLQQKISGSLQLLTKQLAAGSYQIEIRNGQYRKTWEMVKQ